MSKQKVEVSLERSQIADLKKSHHQDILKLISAVQDITKAVDRLNHRVNELAAKLDAFAAVAETPESSEVE